jgi:uncharacterized protein YegJ (DUF2314 family)
MSESPIFFHGGNDPEMLKAHEQARATFKYFWRELTWERQRIIPGLSMAAVKAPFADSPGQATTETPGVEHMWIDEVDFDGQTIRGVLLNEPSWLKSVKAGDEVSLPAKELSDWMYVIGSEVYGAYTVQVLRARMGTAERAEHDEAWGLEFGDPRQVRVVATEKKSGGFFKRLFGSSKSEAADEHPASVNLAPELRKQLAKQPELTSWRDDRGWSLLHVHSLAGNAEVVKVLLDAGFDPNLKTNHGATPLKLAHVLGWEKVAALLMAQGARG